MLTFHVMQTFFLWSVLIFGLIIAHGVQITTKVAYHNDLGIKGHGQLELSEDLTIAPLQRFSCCKKAKCAKNPNQHQSWAIIT